MRYSGADRDDEGPWFRIGNVEVTTTVLVLLVWVLTLLVFVVEPIDKPIMRGMALVPSEVGRGEVWRLVTWPWAHLGFGPFDLIGAAMFWLFGTDLERQTGRRPFAVLIVGSMLIIDAVASFLVVVLSTTTEIVDLNMLTLVVLGLYIAEHPTRPFFFGIPGWMIGAAFVALEVINDLAYREWIRLLTILISAGLIAMLARKVDLLTQYEKVPDLQWPGAKRRRERAAQHFPAPRPAPRPAAEAPEPKRPGPLWRKKDDAPAEIVPMPTSSRRRPIEPVVPDMSADDLALDLLLDKIADGGLDALTAAERQQLDELRARRRKT